MEASNTLNEFVERIRSWIPRRVEAPASTMSRAFWIPDRSCVRCYECESQFTIFNRRHHCRNCGKVFCGKCSLNTLPASVDGLQGVLSEEGERVRVCNYCYKSVQEGEQANTLDGLSPTPSPSSSGRNLASSAIGAGAPVVPTIAPEETLSGGSSNRQVYPDAASPETPDTMRNYQGGSRVHGSISRRARDQPPSPYAFGSNRSDEGSENDEGELSHSGPNQRGEDNDHSHESDSRDNERKSSSSNLSSQSSFGPPNAGFEEGVEGIKRTESSFDVKGEDDPDLESFSRLFQKEGRDAVDFETNDDAWNPPEPAEDEEKKVEEADRAYDDEDDEEEGYWVPTSPGSASSLDLRKPKPVPDDHRRAMRAQVDGHFRALVAQLLLQEFIDGGEEGNSDSWLEIVSSLSWEAANYIKPDKKGSMDPGYYVKVKCIACGKPSDSALVKGVVFRRNVAHRRMTSRLRCPKVLLLGGALEYQRVSNQLSSLDTLLQQEKDHLSMTVSRIESYHPNVLLVEKTVSRSAQDTLLSKEITLVLNVKKPVLERIARCLGTIVVPSPDLLPKVGQTGNCDLFHVEKYCEDLGSAGQQGKQNTKFLMFFEGCLKPQGCTILLKGANGDELKKVKHVMNLTVFAAYHLGLETSFLADEGATFSDLSSRSPMSSSRLMIRSSPIAPIPGFTMLPPVRTQVPQQQDRRGQGANLSVSPLLARRYNTPPGPGIPSPYSAFDSGLSAPEKIPPSASSSRATSATTSPVSSPAQTTFGFQPGLTRGGTAGSTMSGAYFQVSNGGYSGRPFAQGISGISVSLMKEGFSEVMEFGTSGYLKSSERNTSSGAPIPPDSESVATEDSAFGGALGGRDGGASTEGDFGAAEASRKHLRVDVPDSWQSEAEMSSEDFPSDQGSRTREIVVQLSSRCLKKRSVCKAPYFLRIQFYGNNDKTLGSFLRDTLFDASQKCIECEELVNSHVYCFTHRSGSLTISVRKINSDKVLTGEKEGKIWMWHRCLKCPLKLGVPPATHRVVMSDAAWGLSFGKFLELSFSNHEAASRVAACGHSLHRHHLRFYGFGGMVACFRYAEIKLNSVYLPPLQLEFIGPLQEDWLKRETEEVRERGGKFFVEVMQRLTEAGVKAASSSSGTSVATQEVRRRIKELQELQQREQTEFQEILDSACPSVRSPGQPFADILQFNFLRRKLVNSASLWASRLHLLESSLPTKARVTGSIGELGLSHLEAGREPSVSEVITNTTTKPSDAGSSLKSNPGSDPSEATTVVDDSSKENELTSYGDLNKEECDLQKPEELADANGLDHRLGDGTTLTSKDPGSHDADSLSHQNSSVRDLTVANGDPGVDVSVPCERNFVASDNNPCASSEDRDRPTTGVSSTLETEVSTRRALSEGSFPLLATDLSGSLSTWTGERSTDHKQKMDSCTDQVVDCGQASEDLCAKDPPEEPQLLDRGTSGLSSLEGVPASPDKVEDAQHIVPTSPDKQKNESSVDEMLATSNSKTISRTSSNISIASSRSFSPGLSSATSLYVQQEGDPRFLEPGHDDVIVAVYDDEATSLIAYAISSKEHYAHVTDIPAEREKGKEREERDTIERQNSEQFFHPLQLSGAVNDSDASSKGGGSFLEHAVAKLEEIENPLTSTRASQMVKKTVTFWDDSPQGKVKFSVVCYFAKQFDALRKKCCDGNTDYIRSLSRCKKWGAQGGKSNVFFAKTADDRFVVKQVTRTELNSFLDFAPHYFKYLFEALTAGNPTCLAKILGVYEVKVVKGGKETKMDVIVMENLLFGRRISRLYDLKGSKRSRYNTDTSGRNQVLLDSNLLEALPTSPIFVGNKSKKILERAVWNDTNFLSLVFVMDYSLLVGVDEERKELVVGIIDFMRQYTWDKHLETWVKASGILGGPKDATPTVISPKQYKKRFRKAMATYFLMVPDDWIYTKSTMVPATDLNMKGTSTKEDDVGEDFTTPRA